MRSLIIFLSSALIIFCVSCHDKPAEPVKDEGPIPDSVIKNVQVAPAVLESDGDVIKLNGKILPNESHQAKVYALVSGKIESVSVVLGDYVHKGQTLAVLKSTEVAGMTNDMSLAESDVEMAKKSMETSKDLYDSKLATEQDYIAAKITYNKALSALNKSKQVASITGGDHSTYLVKAPLNGYIIEKNITNNSQVRSDNNADLFAIADLSNVWIMANVYESDMNSIHLGDLVKVNTLSNPEKDYLGKIDKVYNVLDPANRTMPVRISMDNPDNELKPEMFATIQVNSKPTGQSLAIPSQAIVMDNSKNYVVVKTAGKLDVREINLIKRIDNKAFITGLSAGEQVVINYQLFLYQALTSK